MLKLDVKAARKAGLLGGGTRKAPVRRRRASIAGLTGKLSARVIDIPDGVVVFIPLRPRVKARPRTFIPENVLREAFETAAGSVERFLSGVKAKTRTPPETRRFERDVTTLVKALLRERPPKAAATEVNFDFSFRRPAKAGHDAQPIEIVYGDWDNLAKAIGDALNEVAYTDDRIITHAHVTKFFHDEDGIFLRIRDGAPCGVPAYWTDAVARADGTPSSET